MKRLGALPLVLALSHVAAASSAEKVWRLGVLEIGTAPGPMSSLIVADLRTLGFTEGANLVVIRRAGQADRLPELSLGLARDPPDVILAILATAAKAARQEMSEVPVVVVTDDPVAFGVARSLARPGSTITGVTTVAELDAKRLELLHEAVPAARHIGVLVPKRRMGDSDQKLIASMHAAAAIAGVDLSFFYVEPLVEDYSSHFASMRNAGIEAVAITTAQEFDRDGAKLAALALDAGLPTVCEWRDMAERGCMIGYGQDRAELVHAAADYLARLLRGAHATELPIQAASHIELAINLKTAHALGIAVPSSVLARADKVIE